MLGDRSDRVSHSVPEAVWEQIAEDLRRGIREGEFPSRFKLPAITELAESYGVAPLTVRRALEALEAEGLVKVRHGKGTFVR